MICRLRGARRPEEESRKHLARLPGIAMQIQAGIHSSDFAGRNWCIFRPVNFGVRSIGSIVSISRSSKD